ncbi:sushi, von Willebrand factor type A, EGF and pentraxin domain-containing protein 1-like [Ptychodera flava]|uniref:sushi, von Willebrand factor type A, EGF and pentraxin domain-containing protein 1-like n=1 Tax=Ptychodera flava TaxID=63121 RepID=UPI003969DABA
MDYGIDRSSRKSIDLADYPANERFKGSVAVTYDVVVEDEAEIMETDIAEAFFEGLNKTEAFQELAVNTETVEFVLVVPTTVMPTQEPEPDQRGDCPRPNRTLHGLFANASGRHGDNVNLHCQDGYSPIGRNSSKCYDGMWYPPLSNLTCALDCSDPGEPESGLQIGMSDYKAGSSVEFGCQYGYQLLGHRYAKCINGNWSAPLPSCIGTCLLPEVPAGSGDYVPVFVFDVPSKYIREIDTRSTAAPFRNRTQEGANNNNSDGQRPGDEQQNGREEPNQGDEMSPLLPESPADILVPHSPIDSPFNYLDLPFSGIGQAGQQREDPTEDEGELEETRDDPNGREQGHRNDSESMLPNSPDDILVPRRQNEDDMQRPVRNDTEPGLSDPQTDIILPNENPFNNFELPQVGSEREPQQSDREDERNDQEDQPRRNGSLPNLPESPADILVPHSPIETPLNYLDLPLPDIGRDEEPSEGRDEEQSEGRQEESLDEYLEREEDRGSDMQPPFLENPGDILVPRNPIESPLNYLNLPVNELPPGQRQPDWQWPGYDDGSHEEPQDEKDEKEQDGDTTPSAPEIPRYGPGEFPDGTQVFFECGPGKTLIGMEVIGCQNGGWNGMVPVCVDVSTESPDVITQENFDYETTERLIDDDEEKPSSTPFTTFRPTCPPTITEGSCENAVTGPSYRSTLVIDAGIEWNDEFVDSRSCEFGETAAQISYKLKTLFNSTSIADQVNCINVDSFTQGSVEVTYDVVVEETADIAENDIAEAFFEGVNKTDVFEELVVNTKAVEFVLVVPTTVVPTREPVRPERGICPTPNRTMYGLFTNTSGRHGDNVTLRCLDGYTPMGRNSSICQNGTWVPSLANLTCARDCSDPGVPENGIQIGKPDYRAGSFVEFSCRYGYQLFGHRYIKCFNGNWTAPPPSCIGTCSRPPFPEDMDGKIPVFIFDIPKQYMVNGSGNFTHKPYIEWPSMDKDKDEEPEQTDQGGQLPLPESPADILIPQSPFNSPLDYLNLPSREQRPLDEHNNEEDQDHDEERGRQQPLQNDTLSGLPDSPADILVPQSPIENPLNYLDLPLHNIGRENDEEDERNRPQQNDTQSVYQNSLAMIWYHKVQLKTHSTT